MWRAYGSMSSQSAVRGYGGPLFSPFSLRPWLLSHSSKVGPSGTASPCILERLARTWPEAEMVGFDPAPGMVEVARSKHRGDGRFRFEIAAAEELPFPDATFDLALSTVSFHHWSDPSRGLQEVARVSRPEARLFLADAYPGGVLRFLAPVIGRLRGECYRTAEELAQLLAQAGFVVLEQRVLPDVGGSVLLTISRSSSS